MTEYEMEKTDLKEIEQYWNSDYVTTKDIVRFMKSTMRRNLNNCAKGYILACFYNHPKVDNTVNDVAMLGNSLAFLGNHIEEEASQLEARGLITSIEILLGIERKLANGR